MKLNIDYFQYKTLNPELTSLTKLTLCTLNTLGVGIILKRGFYFKKLP